MDSTYWCWVRWYINPEETSAGRQPHNLRELYRTNDVADIEVIALSLTLSSVSFSCCLFIDNYC